MDFVFMYGVAAIIIVFVLFRGLKRESTMEVNGVSHYGEDSKEVTMTPDQVTSLVEELREIARHDAEKAHSYENKLHQAVLAAIRDGTCENPAECAKVALTTIDIDFSRWCS